MDNYVVETHLRTGTAVVYGLIRQFFVIWNRYFNLQNVKRFKLIAELVYGKGI